MAKSQQYSDVCAKCGGSAHVCKRMGTCDRAPLKPQEPVPDAPKFLTKAPAPMGLSDIVAHTVDPKWRERYPAIHEHMTCGRWPDGQSREVSTLLFVFDDGAFKACLNDRESERSCWTAGSSFDAILDVLEARLQAGKAEWRGRPTPKGGKRR